MNIEGLINDTASVTGSNIIKFSCDYGKTDRIIYFIYKGLDITK
jgi:hypothetical protein